MSEYRACNRCGNNVAKTSRLCPYCRKKPYSSSRTATVVFLVIVALWVLGNL
jgi:RNA polymerase subunit RPABC4/transcription elongation factor Spt4